MGSTQFIKTIVRGSPAPVRLAQWSKTPLQTQGNKQYKHKSLQLNPAAQPFTLNRDGAGFVVAI